MPHTKKPLALVILDGFGHRTDTTFNAVAQAKKPHLDQWFARYPHTLLDASGAAVGLLSNAIGNSEVGHFIIGAGRTVPQAVRRIHEAIDDGSFFENQTLTQALKNLPPESTLHLMGLLSDGGVHSHIRHLFAFIQAARQAGIKHVVVHAFLDGRDSAPQSAAKYLAELDAFLNHTTEHIGSLHGRFYAMDRNNNWDRTQASYQTLTASLGHTAHSWQSVIARAYQQNITDEFVPPILLSTEYTVKPHDGIIFFNFRADRARQLASAFIDSHFSHFRRPVLPLSFFVTPTDYGCNTPTSALFSNQTIKNSLKDVLAAAGKTVFSIAETEKYAHITYFLGCGRENQYPNEQRVLIPSIATKNYIQHPDMSAAQITEAVLKSVQQNPCDVYFINYANADMVGHSGNFEATVKAVECLDVQLEKLYAAIVQNLHGTLIITADHGNAEDKWDPVAQQPRTAHTNNPVPFLYISPDGAGASYVHSLKSIADIAPFILACLHVPIPSEMKHSTV